MQERIRRIRSVYVISCHPIPSHPYPTYPRILRAAASRNLKSASVSLLIFHIASSPSSSRKKRSAPWPPLSSHHRASALAAFADRLSIEHPKAGRGSQAWRITRDRWTVRSRAPTPCRVGLPVRPNSLPPSAFELTVATSRKAWHTTPRKPLCMPVILTTR
ncbi:uncharacterized protein LY89DRAFT_129289 [Mollisia scopiformis]|uniref:Uncharacterized protein n=1 Tax=Mollisia scopiformis TaxID=149040 RepID=A0A194X4U4_MOLSC|nr:uncharacterized protein LY89DRAFT_129289 [Mollisia scopiformis]KUJ15094.1 hypothetical protein LY89DRAFT_129289 [Mollisia scopiformis]